MYYCKHCGEQYMADNAVICVKCGAPRGKGVNFCQNCGKPVPPNANVCMNCGVSLFVPTDDCKSKVAAGLLGIFLGAFGVHNFYLGYTAKAVIQLVLTIVGFLLACVFIGIFLVAAIEIWGFVEGILILTGNIGYDEQGRPLKP